ncbi:hypothetical protein [Cytobacillus praedii]|uniref:hypothetical protein n=1 Tax=Cytobacillus praedii TaxID=1742358 RepID=UPI002E2183D8|nr:hypothetical protein [Cytobacillus praedii]
MTMTVPTQEEKEVYFALNHIHKVTKHYVLDSTELGMPISGTGFYMDRNDFIETQQIAKKMLEAMLKRNLNTSATALGAFIVSNEDAWKLDSLFRFVFDTKEEKKWEKIFDKSMKIIEKQFGGQ